MDFKHLFSSALELAKTVIRMPDLSLNIVDIIEIGIISVLFYYIMVFLKNTRAWNLFKGIMVILVFVMLAAVFKMNTILWIAQNTLNIGLIALVIIFQPELRSALESIGGRNFFGMFFDFNKKDDAKFTDRTIEELVRASYAMGKVKTGALIVLEDEISMDEYIRTGIDVDAILSSQLLINIFEKNTPLHDGAVIVRGDRVASATCYLPLSDNMNISKALGTRHRAALGISEVSDSLTIIVSEETGYVSVAYKGKMQKNISADELRAQLIALQNRHYQESGSIDKILRRFFDERNNPEIPQ